MAEIKGVDMSYCQSGINYNTLKSDGIKFALLRAGFYTTQDRLLETHIAGLTRVGIPFGLYWYSYAGLKKTTNGYELVSTDHDYLVSEAKKEANAFLDVIKKLGLKSMLSYPAYYDVEEAAHLKVGKRTLTDMAIAFCDILAAAGVFPGIYANPNFMENAYNKGELVGRYDIWLAHWTHNPDKKSSYNYGQQAWQWGITKIGGMDVDADLCFVDYPARIKEWKANKNSEVVAKTGINVNLKNAKLYSDCDRTKLINTISGVYTVVSICKAYGIAVRGTTKVIGYISPTDTKADRTMITDEPYDGIVNAILMGYYDNGEERKKLITQDGYNYSAVQKAVTARLSGTTAKPQLKSTHEIALEVIAGKWDYGKARFDKLAAAGYDGDAVQAEVNRILYGGK